MNPILSICTDVLKLKAHKRIKPIDLQGKSRAALQAEAKAHWKPKIMATGGVNTHYNGDRSVVCLTDEPEGLFDEDFMVMTNYEQVFGFTMINEEDEEIQVEPISEMRALYDSAYPRTPVTLADGSTYIPPLLMGIPLGYDMSHLTV